MNVRLASGRAGTSRSEGPAATATRGPIRLLVIEHRWMFAQALQVALDGTGDIKVVGVAASIAEGVDAARATLPEVILVDYRQPDGNGIDGTRAIKAEHPSAKVVLLTATDSDAILGRAIAAGCCGFVTEDERLEHLAAAIRAAHL